jgi:hypothetical protein
MAALISNPQIRLVLNCEEQRAIHEPTLNGHSLNSFV